MARTVDFANNLSWGTSCGSPRTDWRLPNRKELESLLDFSNHNPTLPTGHPFINVQGGHYWSSTTMAGSNNWAWIVEISWVGIWDALDKPSTNSVWPVRSGK